MNKIIYNNSVNNAIKHFYFVRKCIGTIITDIDCIRCFYTQNKNMYTLK